MTYQLKHATNLLIASLMKQHLIPRIRLRFIQLRDLCGRGASAIVESDSASQSFNSTFSRHALHFDFVNFLDAIASGGHKVCEVAVIGEQQKSFGVEVETSDWMKLVQAKAARVPSRAADLPDRKHSKDNLSVC